MITRTFDALEAKSVRSLGLRDAEDNAIFQAAKEAGVVVMSKDSDFPRLLEQHGPPPQVIWLTCGNTSNRSMREILSQLLPDVVTLLRDGEPIVEVGEL